MESTGVYGKPIFNILEDNFEMMLVNARHVKNVPRRKTDVKDSEWLCKLLRSGTSQGISSLRNLFGNEGTSLGTKGSSFRPLPLKN